MSITYRQLAAHEAERMLEIDNNIPIERVWRKKGGVGEKQWITVNWHQDRDYPDGNENHLAALKETFEQGGYVAGAFDGQKLVGFCAVNRDLFGIRFKYALLDQIFISNGYRGMGIGKTLFFMAAEQARKWGADKFYICAGSSEDTLNFYVYLGCENAKEINHALYQNDVNDIQLEYSFNTISLPIKSDRLYITKFYETMAESLHENPLNDEVIETLDEPREIIDTIIRFYSQDDAPQIYAVRLKNGQHIGHVQAAPIQDGWKIDCHIAKPFADKGYAAEAVAAFQPVIMKHFGIAEIN
ncbi:MAG: GNAT family N-acetyltransferase [Firmicutes bacterium]|nr:GNAT family N-acetyltransferase [Bacillota bacterium]